MPEFVEAASVDHVPPGTGTTVKVAGKEVAIFNLDGTVYAIGDSCPHAGASLGAVKLSGRVVTCRAHGLRYDVTTGLVTTGGFGVASYPAKVVDGRILIAID
ncbi:MAG TPA: Rieske (2Fe-2S) protein [Candidatus Binataceae bacterium]|nr:Rieske (2Fe-2S) protein [Candidatus Binataceae bacterium]